MVATPHRTSNRIAPTPGQAVKGRRYAPRRPSIDPSSVAHIWPGAGPTMVLVILPPHGQDRASRAGRPGPGGPGTIGRMALCTGDGAATTRRAGTSRRAQPREPGADGTQNVIRSLAETMPITLPPSATGRWERTAASSGARLRPRPRQTGADRLRRHHPSRERGPGDAIRDCGHDVPLGEGADQARVLVHPHGPRRAHACAATPTAASRARSPGPPPRRRKPSPARAQSRRPALPQQGPKVPWSGPAHQPPDRRPRLRPAQLHADRGVRRARHGRSTPPVHRVEPEARSPMPAPSRAPGS